MVLYFLSMFPEKCQICGDIKLIRLFVLMYLFSYLRLSLIKYLCSLIEDNTSLSLSYLMERQFSKKYFEKSTDLCALQSSGKNWLEINAVYA